MKQSISDPFLTISGLTLITFTFVAGWGKFSGGIDRHGGWKISGLASRRGGGSVGQQQHSTGAGSTRGLGVIR